MGNTASSSGKQPLLIQQGTDKSTQGKMIALFVSLIIVGIGAIVIIILAALGVFESSSAATIPVTTASPTPTP